MAYIAFVNARSSDVREVSTVAEATAFLEGRATKTGQGGSEKGEGRTPAFIVERAASSGSVVETLEMYDNESVRVVQGLRNQRDAR